MTPRRALRRDVRAQIEAAVALLAARDARLAIAAPTAIAERLRCAQRFAGRGARMAPPGFWGMMLARGAAREKFGARADRLEAARVGALLRRDLKDFATTLGARWRAPDLLAELDGDAVAEMARVLGRDPRGEAIGPRPEAAPLGRDAKIAKIRDATARGAALAALTEAEGWRCLAAFAAATPRPLAALLFDAEARRAMAEALRGAAEAGPAASETAAARIALVEALATPQPEGAA